MSKETRDRVAEILTKHFKNELEDFKKLDAHYTDRDSLFRQPQEFFNRGPNLIRAIERLESMRVSEPVKMNQHFFNQLATDPSLPTWDTIAKDTWFNEIKYGLMETEDWDKNRLALNWRLQALAIQLDYNDGKPLPLPAEQGTNADTVKGWFSWLWSGWGSRG